MADEKLLVDIAGIKNRQKHYETVFILSPALNETTVQEILEKNLKTARDYSATVFAL